MGRRNTNVNRLQCLVKGFRECFPSEGVARSSIGDDRHRGEVVRVVLAQVDAFWNIMT